MADDPTIRWTQATSFGVSMDPARDAWHSGHVTDVLELPDADGFLVATETGGVWLVNDNGTQLQLSDSWNDPDVAALAFGPDGSRHVFAGCTQRYNGPPFQSVPVIMETDVWAAAPLLNWKPVVGVLPTGAGSITSVAVISHLRRIIVACAKALPQDTGGIYWAVIPPSGVTRPPFVWKRADVENEPYEGFYALAIGSTSDQTHRDQLENVREITVVAGGKAGGLFVGRFDAGELVVKRAQQVSDGNVNVNILDSAAACSVASCALRPNNVYASCAMTDGRMMEVVRSEDGGKTWRGCRSQLLGGAWGSLLPAAGERGNDWNNCVGVAPDDPNLVAVGWQDGPFVSLDAGQTWQQVAGKPHLHADLHTLVFTKKTQDGDRVLLVGSDGGLASVNLDAYLRGTGEPFRSNYNRNLPTLQFYATLIRQFYGTLDGSVAHAGLVCAGAQDNGNLYCRLSDVEKRWVHLDGGDGGWNAFLSDGALAHNSMGKSVHVASFANPTIIDVNVGLTLPPDPNGVLGPVGEAVSHPTYRNGAHHLLTAVAAVRNDVYGLYVDDNDAPRYHWERIISLPAGIVVTAVASFHGGTVFGGTQGDGRMFAIDTRQGTALELPVVLPKPTPTTRMAGGTFTRIVAFHESAVFAVLNTATPQRELGRLLPPGFAPPLPIPVSYVLRLDGLKWTPTPSVGLSGEYLYGCAAVSVPNSEVRRALFVSTDDAVYISRDDGASWLRASHGLPRRPHCGDLRFVGNGRAGHNLYLGTYGRSLWVAPLAPGNG